MQKKLHNLLLKVASWLEKKPKAWGSESTYVIEPAFHDGVEQQYMMQDFRNIASGRGLACLDALEIWSMRLTADYLKQVIAKRKEIYKRPSFSVSDLMELKQIDNDLEERILFPIPTADVIYEFAARVFFEKKESLVAYDEEYGKVKIARWKKQNLPDFFLSIPINKLINLEPLSPIDSRQFLETLEQIDEIHRSRLSLQN